MEADIDVLVKRYRVIRGQEGTDLQKYERHTNVQQCEEKNRKQSPHTHSQLNEIIKIFSLFLSVDSNKSTFLQIFDIFEWRYVFWV